MSDEKEVPLAPHERLCPACNGEGRLTELEKRYSLGGMEWVKRPNRLCWLCLGKGKIRKDQFGKQPRRKRRR